MSDDEGGLKKNDSHDTQDTFLALGVLGNDESALIGAHHDTDLAGEVEPPILPDYAREILPNLLRQCGVDDSDPGARKLQKVFQVALLI